MLTTEMIVYPGIMMRPDVREGRPCLVGTRLEVATVLQMLAGGQSVEWVIENYQLSRRQVDAVLAYAAHVVAHVPPVVEDLP